MTHVWRFFLGSLRLFHAGTEVKILANRNLKFSPATEALALPQIAD